MPPTLVELYDDPQFRAEYPAWQAIRDSLLQDPSMNTEITERVMGIDMRPPPPSVQAVEPDIRGAVTIRQQLEKHRADKSCAACHRAMDPPGFALESFDVMGAFDPANPSTYPSRFRIRLGDSFFDVEDRRTNAFVSDKWRATDKLTLNLGVRYDYSDIVPDTKDAVAPRIGVAYAPSDRMVFRGGINFFSELRPGSLQRDANTAAGLSEAQLQALQRGPATPVVRPAWNDPVLIKRVLDIGAQSVLLPASSIRRGSPIITTAPVKGKDLTEGSVAFTISGRPALVLQGAVPAHRDITPGVVGDVLRRVGNRQGVPPRQRRFHRSLSAGGESDRHHHLERRWRAALPSAAGCPRRLRAPASLPALRHRSPVPVAGADRHHIRNPPRPPLSPVGCRLAGRACHTHAQRSDRSHVGGPRCRHVDPFRPLQQAQHDHRRGHRR